MEPLNLRSINSNVYTREEEERRSIIAMNETVHRFVLQNASSQEVVDSAVTVIRSLLKNNPQLCFVSKPLEGESLEEKIKSCPFLIINGHALCLSDQLKASNDIDPLCTDRFFSEAVLQEPVQCSRGRTFERRYIAVWLESKGNRCRCSNHELDSIEIDLYLLQRIHTILRSRQQHDESIRGTVERLENQDRIIRQTQQENRRTQQENQSQAQIIRNTQERMQQVEEERQQAQTDKLIQNARIAFLESSITRNRTFEVASGSGKIVAKGITFLLSKVAEMTGESAVRSIVKKLSPVYLVFGAISAVRRYNDYKNNNDEAQYYKAMVEIASVLASCVPGPGTVLGFALDVGMLRHDICETKPKKSDINTAHKMLGLDPKQNPTKEEIDKAFRQLSLLSHPDPIKEGGEHCQKRWNGFQSKLAQCKQQMYRYYSL